MGAADPETTTAAPTVWSADASTEFVLPMIVLLVRVCASVLPTTVPAGTTLVVMTALVPFPVRNAPAASVVAPVPPLATPSVPPIELSANVVWSIA